MAWREESLGLAMMHVQCVYVRMTISRTVLADGGKNSSSTTVFYGVRTTRAPVVVPMVSVVINDVVESEVVGMTAVRR